jgi:hypothetical protein
MARKKVLFKKKQNPTLKIDPATYNKLKAEADYLSRGYSKIKLGELLSFILDVYFNNKDLFSDLTGGTIGTQPDFEAEELDNRPKKEKKDKQARLI